MSDYPFNCPAEGCDGGFFTDTVTDGAGTRHHSIETNCHHAVLPCEYCENPTLADKIVLASPPDVDQQEKTVKSVLCEGCAKANRAFALSGWSE
jgi:hypothetical protein